MYYVAHLPSAVITKEMQAPCGKANSLYMSHFFPGSMLSALILKENITEKKRNRNLTVSLHHFDRLRMYGALPALPHLYLHCLLLD